MSAKIQFEKERTGREFTAEQEKALGIISSEQQ